MEAYENKHLLDLQMDQFYQNSLTSSKSMVIYPPQISDLGQIADYAEQITVSTGMKKPTRAKGKPKPKAKPVAVSTSDGGNDLRERFIHIVQSTGLISSKAKMQALMEENGFTLTEFNQMFNLLKEKEGILKYSRSSPRGYSIQSTESVIIDTELPVQTEGTITIDTKSAALKEKEIKPEPLVSKPEELEKPNEAFLDLIKSHQPVSSKAKLLELAETININKKSAEAIIAQLKELGILSYSKSAPRGWSAN
jgi:hypothetical protein